MKGFDLEKFEKAIYVFVKVILCLMMIWTVVFFLEPDILNLTGFYEVDTSESTSRAIIYGASVLALAILCRKNK